jgi:hypothetical protein
MPTVVSRDYPPAITFESNTPEQALAEGAAGKFDYGQVEGALRNDFMVAENVFARCAKHHFRQLLGDKVRLEEPGHDIPSPHWVVSTSVVLYLDEGKLDAKQLEETTKALAAGITQLRGEKTIRLLGALNVKLLQVGVHLFKFALQQKWCFDGG